jgi:hypothetical protein
MADINTSDLLAAAYKYIDINALIEDVTMKAKKDKYMDDSLIKLVLMHPQIDDNLEALEALIIECYAMDKITEDINTILYDKFHDIAKKVLEPKISDFDDDHISIYTFQLATNNLDFMTLNAEHISIGFLQLFLLHYFGENEDKLFDYDNVWPKMTRILISNSNEMQDIKWVCDNIFEHFDLERKNDSEWSCIRPGLINVIPKDLMIKYKTCCPDMKFDS